MADLTPGRAATGGPDPQAPTDRPAGGVTRSLLAGCIGHAAESFDWYTYSFLAIYFSARIFPTRGADPLVPLLSAFAVFAVGFLMRPVGALLLGVLADRRGRRQAFGSGILMMAVGSLLIAVVPTYETAGVGAPLVLTAARLLQGLSLGGEYSASTTFLVEAAPPGRRGFFGSFQYVGSIVGQLLASGLAAVLATTLGREDMTAWGWRVPFALGAAIAVVGWYLRRGAVETAPARVDGGDPVRRRFGGLFDALRATPRQSLRIVGMTLAGTVAYYTWSTYVPVYTALRTGTDPVRTLWAATVALALFGLLQPALGALSDRVGRRPLLLFFSVGTAVCAVPLLSVGGTGATTLVAVQAIGLLLVAGYTATAAAANAELFPRAVRAAGSGFPYSLTVAVFGGTVPYLGTWLASAGAVSVFPWYLVAVCLVSTVVFLGLPESADRPLPG